jgi:signal transduction histidine kinase
MKTSWARVRRALHVGAIDTTRKEVAKVQKRLGLRVEMMAVLALLLTTALLSLGWLNGSRSQERHLDRAYLWGRHHAHILARLLPLVAGRQDQIEGPQVHALLAAMVGPLAENEIGARITGAEVLVHRPQGWIRTAWHGDNGDPPGTFESANTDQQVESAWSREASDLPLRRAITKPILLGGGGQEIKLRLWLECDPPQDFAAIADTFLAAAVVGLVCMILGGLLLEMTVLLPLRRLEHATQRLASGEREVEIELSGASELAILAERFNEMSRAIHTQQQTLVEQAEQVRKSERLAAIGRVAAGLAHELGNPLAALLGYVNYLVDPRTCKLDAQDRDVLARVAAQAERMQETIGTFLDKSRPDALKIGALDLESLRREVTQAAEGHPWLKQASVNWVFATDAACCGDLGLTRQILVNLLLNAGKACLEQSIAPQILLHVREEGAHVILSVCDNGPGIPEAWRDQIFEPFFTRPSSQAAANAPGGHGLGLAISRGLAEQEGGTLQLVSKTTPLDVSAEGIYVGARFELRLLRAPSDEIAQSA